MSPAVVIGILYDISFGEGRQGEYAVLVTFDVQTGSVVWQEPQTTNIYASPVVVNGKLYVATYFGDVLAYGLNPN